MFEQPDHRSAAPFALADVKLSDTGRSVAEIDKYSPKAALRLRRLVG
jgi:hypothetical protein